MGKAVWLVLLLLLPLSPNSAPPTSVEEVDKGQTWVLDYGDSVWTEAAWSALMEQGVQPLRHLTPHQLLIWSQGEHAPDVPGVDAVRAPMAEWRGGLDGGSVEHHAAVRLVLEPYLPVDVKRSIHDSLLIHGDPIGEGLDLQHPMASVITLKPHHTTELSALFKMPGVAWIEPVLTPKARNGQAASLTEHGSMTDHPFWDIGLDGSGVVLAVADSGLDADHACFRNATSSESTHAESDAEHPALGIVGPDHRKILILNTSVDGNDTPGHTDYRHGTHVAGTLVCRDVQSLRSDDRPRNGSALAHGAVLVFQDIVNEDGWSPPSVDELLVEASRHGAIVHSNSWGDDTTAYTARTGLFDAYAIAVPWSLAFIAPGNAGEGVLEPANGRNVVAVSATSKASDPQRWQGTSFGPTEAETDGIFLLAPGRSIQSAAADGFLDTNNNNLRSSSGTSMATPVAAGGAGIIQQMYEQGWILGPREPTLEVLLSDGSPSWSESNNATIRLGQGFTPSGALLRATMALATSPLNEEHRNGGEGGDDWRNTHDGWGVFNLSRLFDPTALQHNSTPTPNLWVHDSYRLNGSLDEWKAARLWDGNNITAVTSSPWYGEGAEGPFLQTGEQWGRRFTPIAGEDVLIRMAFPAKPEPMMVDDLQLKVRLSDGRVLLGDHWQNNGTPTIFSDAVDTSNFEMFPSSNETTVALNIPASLLNGTTHFDVEVAARFIAHGNLSGAVGLGGGAAGFALAVQGVDRDSNDHGDDDLDGVLNIDDLCPGQDATTDDDDSDGCLDDDDGDGVVNVDDDCPDRPATGHDTNLDGCLDDSDEDGVTDDVDECSTEDVAWPVNSTGCYPLDRSPRLLNMTAPANGSEVIENLTVQWTVADPDGDAVRVVVEIREYGFTHTSIASCEGHVDADASPTTHTCGWVLPGDFPPYTPHDQTFDVVVVVTSLNASPAADRSSVETIVATNLSLTWSGEAGVISLPTSSGDDSWPLLYLTALGGVSGIMFMQWFSRGRRSPSSDEVGPPFADEGVADKAN